MEVKYKRGDVTIVVDMLTDITVTNSGQWIWPAGTADYIGSGELLQRTVLLSNIVLPVISSYMDRESIVPCEVLSHSERVEGLDVFRLLINDIEKLFKEKRYYLILQNHLINLA